MGSNVRRVLLVGCEPETQTNEDGMGLSEPVQSAVPEAIVLVESLVARLQGGEVANNPGGIR
jgi:Ni,Fe-hydrogenase maturation factor